MQFMLIRKADEETEAGAMPSEELVTAMMNYNEELVKAGVLLGGDGLKPSSAGVRVQFSDGKPEVIDGPFAEAKELVAGFTIIDVPSKEEAIEWVKRWPAEDANGSAVIEIRPFVEIDDFGDGFTPELREKEAQLREQVERQ
jgi:hypothetical protein